MRTHRARRGCWLALAGLLAAGMAWGAEDSKPKIPSEAVQHFNDGFFQAAKGNYDEAARQYRKAIEIYPEYAQAHHNLGSILQNAGELDDAVEHFRTALACPGLEKPWIVHNSLGIALDNKGDLDGAIEAYRKAIELDPQPAFPQHNLALALARKGDLEGALEAIRKAAELAPLDPRIKRNLEILQKRAQHSGSEPPATPPPTEVNPMPPEPTEPTEPTQPPEPAQPPVEPVAPTPASERPLAFEAGSFWRIAEEGEGFVLLKAPAVEGVQARIEWEQSAQQSVSDVVEAELSRVQRLAFRAEAAPWPQVGGREAAAYTYDLGPFGVTIRTQAVVVVNEGQAYRFALSGAESIYGQGEAPFRALLESVRFE